MNYYQHHIGDFIRDTARLSDGQCMAYLRMIWMYYETEQPLNNDVEALAFKLGASISDVLQILKHFFFEHEGMWHHARCDKEILSFRSRSDKAKKAISARWENARSIRTVPDASHQNTQTIPGEYPENTPSTKNDTNQEPVTNNQEKEKDKTPTSLRDHVPITSIVNLYHEKLPSLPACKKLTKAREGQIKQRWREDLPALKNWENYFAYIAQSDFLMGRAQASNGRPPFQANLEWITKAANYTKILEGKYHGV